MKVYFIYTRPSLNSPNTVSNIISSLNNHFTLEDVNYNLYHMNLDKSPMSTDNYIEYMVRMNNYEINIKDDYMQLGLTFEDIYPKNDLDYVFKNIGRDLESVLNTKLIEVYF